MNDVIRKSCAEFAANPVAGGAKWTNVYTISCFICEICDVSIKIDYMDSVGYYMEKNRIVYSPLKLNTTDARLAAEKAISLCRDRVEKMYLEFQKLKEPIQ